MIVRDASALGLGKFDELLAVPGTNHSSQKTVPSLRGFQRFDSLFEREAVKAAVIESATIDKIRDAAPS